MNSTVSSANYFSEAPPRGASSQPREREARTDTPTHPPSPRRTAPQPRASPGGGRPAAIPHRLGRTRAGSKLSAGPPRGAAQHRQPQKGAERACDASTYERAPSLRRTTLYSRPHVQDRYSKQTIIYERAVAARTAARATVHAVGPAARCHERREHADRLIA